MKDSPSDTMSVAVLRARECCPAVVERLLVLCESGSPDIAVKAARCLASIMQIDRANLR